MQQKEATTKLTATSDASSPDLGRIEVVISVANHSSTSPKGYLRTVVDFFNLHTITTSGHNYSSFVFKDNYRCSENCIEAGNLVVLDVDGGTSIDEAKEKLKDFTYLISTTRNHQKDKRGIVCDRFRILIPTSSKLPHDKISYKKVVKELVSKFDLQVDNATIENARFFYSNKQAFSWYNTANLLNWAELVNQPLETEISKPQKPLVSTIVNNKEINKTRKAFKADPELIRQRCAAVGYAYEHPAALGYSQWLYACGVLAWCKDGNQHVHQFSSLDTARYEPRETERNYQSAIQKLRSSPSCHTMSQEFSQCATCPYNGLAHNPLAIGLEKMNLRKENIEISPETFLNNIRSNELLSEFYHNKKVSFVNHTFKTVKGLDEDIVAATVQRVLKDRAESTKERVAYYINLLFFRKDSPSVVIDKSGMSSGKTYSIYSLAEEMLKVIESFPPEQRKLCEYKIRFVTQSPTAVLDDKDLPFANSDLFCHLEGRNESNCNMYKEATMLLQKGHGHFIDQLVCDKCELAKACKYYSNKTRAKTSHTISTGISLLGIKDFLDIVLVDEGTARHSLVECIPIKVEDIHNIYNSISNCPELRLILSESLLMLNDLLTSTDNLFDVQIKERIKKSKAYALIAELEKPEEFNEQLKKYFYKKYFSYLPDDIPFDGTVNMLNLIKNIDQYGLSLNKGNNSLNFHTMSIFWDTILEKVQNRSLKILGILDGTPDKYFVKLLESRGIKYEIVDFSVEPSQKNIVQLLDSTWSKTSLQSKLTFKDQQLIKKFTTDTSKVGVISFKDKLPELEELFKSENIQTQLQTGYFGLHDRGTNTFNDCDALIIYGRYLKNIAVLSAEAYVLSQYIDINLESEVMLLGYPETNMAVVRKNYNEYATHGYENALKQAINRVGRKGNQQGQVPQVIIFTNEPADISGVTYSSSALLLNETEKVTPDQAVYNEKRSLIALSNREKVHSTLVELEKSGKKVSIRLLAELTGLGKDTCNKHWKEIKAEI